MAFIPMGYFCGGISRDKFLTNLAFFTISYMLIEKKYDIFGYEPSMSLQSILFNTVLYCVILNCVCMHSVLTLVWVDSA